MFIAADYPFLDVLWTMLIFFAWIIWFWLLITVFADVFRRHDTSGFAKVLWIIFVIVLPFLGVFIYLIVNHDGMTQRSMNEAQTQRAQMDDYVRSVAGSGGAAAEIERAKGLLDSGAITQAEFDAIKAKALAAS
ncbi:SHOCT domain-containing protein [Gaiella sp.]|uniref:SHOCT domain-containing protein n=1 Tax=Gaiella sp. TaxID=2663207 RepID=UPI002B92CE42|nr:SHOCT domain-containing protein [Gaiella sp.]HWO80829.1 SHOCT domain-containing protein [Gaiella sp.]